MVVNYLGFSLCVFLPRIIGPIISGENTHKHATKTACVGRVINVSSRPSFTPLAPKNDAFTPGIFNPSKFTQAFGLVNFEFV